MNDNIIDARKQKCPMPLILIKKALNDPNIPDEFIILIDNETAKENIERFLQDNGISHQTDHQNNGYQIKVNKSGKTIDSSSDIYCTNSPKEYLTGDHIIVINNDEMGIGENDLGNLLVQNFIKTIKEVSPLPKKIIFYNSGVKLTLRDSPVISSLKELEESDVEILLCGTCVDYYKIKDKIGCGRISNMYEITDSLTKTSHIITP